VIGEGRFAAITAVMRGNFALMQLVVYVVQTVVQPVVRAQTSIVASIGRNTRVVVMANVLTHLLSSVAGIG